MASSFSYTFDLSSEKKFVKFLSETGLECYLIHELTWTIYGNSLLNISFECNANDNVLITAELYSASDKTVKGSSLLEDHHATLNFQNVNFLTPEPWRCLISVIPHMELHDVVQESTATSVLTPVKRGSIRRSKLEQLSADMQRILITGEQSDVILTDGVNKIQAHKVVLSARSPVFSKMFQHQMIENAENSVTISDIPGEVLKELVSFIYTGNITLKEAKMASSLFIAADKYAVTDLKELCSDIMRNVSCEDVLETLALADLYEDKSLKRSALDFISKNYSQMKNSKDWECFMKENQALAIEILSFVIENKT